jgi:hypothetical protein
MIPGGVLADCCVPLLETHQSKLLFGKPLSDEKRVTYRHENALLNNIPLLSTVMDYPLKTAPFITVPA